MTEFDESNVKSNYEPFDALNTTRVTDRKLGVTNAR